MFALISQVNYVITGLYLGRKSKVDRDQSKSLKKKYIQYVIDFASQIIDPRPKRIKKGLVGGGSFFQ